MSQGLGLGPSNLVLLGFAKWRGANPKEACEQIHAHPVGEPRPPPRPEAWFLISRKKYRLFDWYESIVMISLRKAAWSFTCIKCYGNIISRHACQLKHDLLLRFFICFRSPRFAPAKIFCIITLWSLFLQYLYYLRTASRYFCCPRFLSLPETPWFPDKVKWEWKDSGQVWGGEDGEQTRARTPSEVNDSLRAVALRDEQAPGVWFTQAVHELETIAISFITI